MKRIMLMFLTGFIAASLNAQTNTAPPSGVSEARVEALKKLRFGMFVCWSFSTFSGKEWTPGVTNIDLFAAKDCDTDQWVKTAKEASMGYILFLTKHHDGFCLWDTKTTERKVTKAPLGRDVLAALRKSCNKYGLKLALYFSEGEFEDNALYHPGGYTPEMKKAQLKELLTQYGPIQYVWFDHAQTDGGLNHAETFAFCKSLQPDCFIGFNHGDQSEADIRLGEMGRPGPLADQGAAGPYMKIPAGKNYRLAEFTYPILPEHQDGAMWFYSRPKHDTLCLPAEKIYADYLGAVKFGNLFSLDVGPDYKGRLRDIDVKTLRQVGRYIRGEKAPPRAPAVAATLTIENKSLSVAYDAAAGIFSVVEKASGSIFLKGGKLEGAAVKAEVQDVRDAVFGSGKSIVVAQTDGCAASLELYRDLPFVLVRGTRCNQGQETLDLAKVVPATFTLDLGQPASELRTMGTAGLTAPDKNPGSYLFLTAAVPATRRGVVAGWLTEDRGSGVLFSSVRDSAVEFKAQIDYGHLRIPPGTSAKLETLAVGVFDDARLGEEFYADALKKQYHIKLRPQTAVYCSWYAEKHGLAGDETSTVELAKFAARELKPFGFGVVQIDDEWQDGPKLNGPRRGFDRARPDGPYAHGIAPVAAEVEKAGLTFGLWWLPFGRNYQDPQYKDRQHWFVKRLDGKPYDTDWGGTCLDLTHPEVKAHLAKLAKTIRSWGVKYYKMDGLWTGAACEQIYVNDGYKDDHFGNNLPFYDPLKSNIEAYRDGLKLIRQNAGDEVFFSGCCVSQNERELCALGLVDSMRIGPDYNADGKGTRTGPIRGSRLYFLNGRVWWNDPDPCIVRASGAAMGCQPVSLEQARLGASWVAMAGQFYLNSDWLPALPAERLEVMKRTMLSHGATARPVDYFDNFLPTTWLVTDTRQPVRRDVIGVFNQETNELNIDYSCAKLGLDPAKTYYGFDFWANSPVPSFQGAFQCQLPPTSCRIIAVRGVEGHPVLVSTSRHVTQGIVDVTGEKWNAVRKTLSAVSQVVANDSYELRLAGLDEGGRKWKLLTATVSVKDKAAVVVIAPKPDVAGEDGWCRVGINAKQSRSVHWTLEFTGD